MPAHIHIYGVGGARRFDLHDFWRKPEYLEETHTGTERTHKLHTKFSEEKTQNLSAVRGQNNDTIFDMNDTFFKH